MSWDFTSVKGSAVGVALAVDARSVSLTVREFSVGGATSVGGAGEWVYTDTSGTHSVRSHWGRSIVGNAVGIVGAGTATSILVTVLAAWAGTVRGTGSFTDLGGRVADGLSRGFTTITHPGVVRAVSVGTAIEAETASHAVGSLGSNTLGVGGASSGTLARGLVTVRLVWGLTTIVD